MPRSRHHLPLSVYMGTHLIGHLLKEASGAISFRYAPLWLSHPNSRPVSLSLPLREDAYRGQEVAAVFENLLPDSTPLRNRIAAKVGAQGTDAYSLLSMIGRDCIGALQFCPEGTAPSDAGKIEGEEVNEEEIENLLANLARAPLGVDSESDFRISVAGAQEKTALLRHDGKWWKPHGTTPTTHIFKTPIGRLQNGLDLSNSVENEFYCLKLITHFGLAANRAEMVRFGTIKSLVIERFDRHWTPEGRLARIPQEDLCQALSVPPTLKYQTDGGPGMVEILRLLQGADQPGKDQGIFLKAQILFWLLGATDGHAKNFSIFLGRGGAFRLAPIYDVLSAQPSADSRQIERKQMKLAMFAGSNRHYQIEEIRGRHFVQTAERAGIPPEIAKSALREIAEAVPGIESKMASELPGDFPAQVHESILGGLKSRLSRLAE